MTIQREYRSGPFVVQCDDCGEAEELEHTEFNEALADAKSRGYVVRKQGETWQHYCKGCA